MAVAVRSALTISLDQGDTELDSCRLLPELEYGDGFYAAPRHPLSIAELPLSGYGYEMSCSRCVRQNARAATRRGYRYRQIDRADFEDDLFEIRSSQLVRQGRPMPRAYLDRQKYGSDAWPGGHCKRHLSTVHGVLTETRLVGYCQVVQCGEVVRFNTILGHWSHLNHGVMWLLVLEALKWHIDECGAAYALYYTHESGHGPGLRYFKERFGFRPTEVEWQF